MSVRGDNTQTVATQLEQRSTTPDKRDAPALVTSAQEPTSTPTPSLPDVPYEVLTVPGDGALMAPVAGSCSSRESILAVENWQTIAKVHFDTACAQFQEDVLLNPQGRSLFVLTVDSTVAHALGGVHTVVGPPSPVNADVPHEVLAVAITEDPTVQSQVVVDPVWLDQLWQDFVAGLPAPDLPAEHRALVVLAPPQRPALNLAATCSHCLAVPACT